MTGWLYDAVLQHTGRLLDTSDQALDRAAGFQDGFATYLPLYNDYTGSTLSLEHDVQRPYDELREIDFASLSQLAERCARVGDDFDERLRDVTRRVGAAGGWSGPAADAFRGHVQQFQVASQTISDGVAAVATATAGAVPAAQQVVCEYVAAIGDIDFSGFDSPDDIAFMIDVERMLKSVSDVVRAVLDWLGDLIGIALPLPGGGGDVLGSVTGFAMDRLGDTVDFVLDALGMSVDGFLEWVASKVREYLAASFRAPFDANLALLHDAVDAARTGIRDAFQPVITAAATVVENPFAALPVPPQGQPQPPVSPVPPPGSPQGQPSGDTGGASWGGVPAGHSQVPGVPAVGDQGRFGEDGTPSSLTMRDGDVTITVSADGGPADGVTFTLTGGDGDTTGYTVGIGDGRPMLTPVAGSDPTTAGDVSGPAATLTAGGGTDGGTASGEISGGGPNLAAGDHVGTVLGDGPVLSGLIGTPLGEGSAQLASVSESPSPGAAQLASVGEDTRTAGQHATGAPMMPVASGSVGGGDGERRGGGWLAPDGGIFDPPEDPAGETNTETAGETDGALLGDVSDHGRR